MSDIFFTDKGIFNSNNISTPIPVSITPYTFPVTNSYFFTDKGLYRSEIISSSIPISITPYTFPASISYFFTDKGVFYTDLIAPTILAFEISKEYRITRDTEFPIKIPVALAFYDNQGVTGIIIDIQIDNEYIEPALTDTDWNLNYKSSYDFYGVNKWRFTVYIKDAAGNITSAYKTCNIYYEDTDKPIITSFTMQKTVIANNNIATIETQFSFSDSPISSMIYTYYISDTNDNNVLSDKWIEYNITNTDAEVFDITTNYTYDTTSLTQTHNNKTFYLWVKDAAGNISDVATTNVEITIPDSIEPTASQFTIESQTNTDIIKVLEITADDNNPQDLEYQITLQDENFDDNKWSKIKPAIYILKNIKPNIEKSVILTLHVRDSNPVNHVSIDSNDCIVLKTTSNVIFTEEQTKSVFSYNNNKEINNNTNSSTNNSIYYFDFSKKGKDLLLKKDVPVLTNSNAIRESLINLISTEKETFIYDPERGINLNRFTFEPIDNVTASMIRYELKLAIEQYESRVSNVVVNVIPKEDENSYEINIEYDEIYNSHRQSLTIDFQKIL